jgi:ribosomal protein S18 acetylase RimI-like enzyme
MAAALVRPRAASEHGSLQPTNLIRDLYQIAQLVEVCFGSSLDSSGRAAIEEMKWVGRLGPLLLIVALLDRLGIEMGRGFVWRVGRRVVGNVSLFAAGHHPWLGRGWLIANVAVHPTYQRRGIAHVLMQAAMARVEKQHGRWVGLQVEEDNSAALALYQGMNFTIYETLNQWESTRGMEREPDFETDELKVRPRTPADGPAEIDLIFRRARVGAMAWTQPINKADVQGSLFEGTDFSKERWVLPDSVQPSRLLGSLWVVSSGWRRSRISLFLDPALKSPSARQALLRAVLARPDMKNRIIRVETTAGDGPVEELLHSLGFHKTRSLIQMRYEIPW